MSSADEKVWTQIKSKRSDGILGGGGGGGVFLKDFFIKNYFLKKSAEEKKLMKNYSRCKELMHVSLVH